MYTSPECCVTNNGFHTKFFPIQRGIRQGCPISAFLFILCAEVLAIAIREQQDIKGLKIGNKEIKITQYADDTCLYLNGSNSLENIVKLFEDFYRYAGLKKLNIDKRDTIWLGRNNRYGKICNIKITQEPVKVLGIWTIKGKIAVVKAKALPLITYVTNFIYVPKDVIEIIDKLLTEFVWKKKHHVKRSNLIEKIAKGGE